MSDSWAGGSTRQWRKLRTRVLTENALLNGGRCTLQLDGVCTGPATTVHHVKGRRVTGDDPRYLVAACAPCNLKIGDPTRQGDPPCVAVTHW